MKYIILDWDEFDSGESFTGIACSHVKKFASVKAFYDATAKDHLPSLQGIELNEFITDVKKNPKKHCKWVKLAVKRHASDLKSKRYSFDKKEADRAIKFISLLKHTKGEWAGKTFNLKPFQAFIIFRNKILYS